MLLLAAVRGPLLFALGLGFSCWGYSRAVWKMGCWGSWNFSVLVTRPGLCLTSRTRSCPMLRPFWLPLAVGASVLVVQGRLLVQLFVSLFCRGGLWLLL